MKYIHGARRSNPGEVVRGHPGSMGLEATARYIVLYRGPGEKEGGVACHFDDAQREEMWDAYCCELAEVTIGDDNMVKKIEVIKA